MSQEQAEKKEITRQTDLFNKIWDAIVKNSNAVAISRDLTNYLTSEMKKTDYQN